MRSFPDYTELVPSLSFHLHIVYHNATTSSFSVLYLSKLSLPSIFCCVHNENAICVEGPKKKKQPKILTSFSNNPYFQIYYTSIKKKKKKFKITDYLNVPLLKTK